MAGNDDTDTTTADVYLARVGRAGAFGNKGLVVSFISSPEDDAVLEQVRGITIGRFWFRRFSNNYRLAALKQVCVSGVDLRRWWRGASTLSTERGRRIAPCLVYRRGLRLINRRGVLLFQCLFKFVVLHLLRAGILLL
jgi:hypothetical protein